MKKFLLLLVAVLLCATVFSGRSLAIVQAEGEDLEETEETTDINEMSESEILTYCIYNYASDECEPYRAQVLQKKSQISQELVNAQTDEKELSALIDQYDAEVNSLQGEVDALNTKIDELQKRIDELAVNIEKNESLVKDLNDRVLGRMREAQKTMHFNPMLDFLLGSKSFADLLRRSYGIDAINTKEQNDLNVLSDTIKQLNSDKQELDTSKAQLDESKKALEEKQMDLIIKRDAVAEEKAAIAERIAELQNQQEAYQYIDTSNLRDIVNIPASEGFITPIPGAGISAGPWSYEEWGYSGGTHLGADYAAGRGTNIYAPANGVVFVSDSNCDYEGWIGCSCGGAGGGVSYGGNQIYMMVAAGGSVFGVTFSHLTYGSLVPTGVYNQGDYIAQVGNTGNTSGPHAHVELFYLGPGDTDDLYNDYLQRSYTGSFNCGWGDYALSNTCEANGYSAPCRVNPILYLGA